MHDSDDSGSRELCGDDSKPGSQAVHHLSCARGADLLPDVRLPRLLSGDAEYVPDLYFPDHRGGHQDDFRSGTQRRRDVFDPEGVQPARHRAGTQLSFAGAGAGGHRPAGKRCGSAGCQPVHSGGLSVPDAEMAQKRRRSQPAAVDARAQAAGQQHLTKKNPGDCYTGLPGFAGGQPVGHHRPADGDRTAFPCNGHWHRSSCWLAMGRISRRRSWSTERYTTTCTALTAAKRW